MGVLNEEVYRLKKFCVGREFLVCVCIFVLYVYHYFFLIRTLRFSCFPFHVSPPPNLQVYLCVFFFIYQ